jgi:chitinase
MQAFINAGVPLKKLTMGLAWYGRGFKASSTSNDGLYQVSQGADSTGFAEVGWSQLRSQILIANPTTPVNAWKRTMREVAVCPTLFNAGTRSLVAYDDPESIAKKSTWAKQRGLGGVMVWSLDMDINREMLSATLSPWK